MNSSLQDLAARWVAAQARESGADEGELPLIFAVQDLTTQPERLWEFILAAEPLCNGPHARGMLAAGPLEDLIQDFGSAYIDRIESQARRSRTFAELLTGVWIPTGTDPVTVRYLALGCDQVRPPA